MLIPDFHPGFVCSSWLRLVGKSDIRHGAAQVRQSNPEDGDDGDSDDFLRLLL